VWPRRSTERLKAQLLKAAVEDNLDAIHSRVPPGVRPWRQRLYRWPLVISRVALPVGAVMAGAALARWPAKPAAEPATPAAPTAAAPAAAARPAAPSRSASGNGLAAATTQPIRPGVLALTVRRVIIDAGHGGDNTGASSTTGLLEKQLTLDIAERVRQLMTTAGFEAIMTRTKDEALSLQQRATIANGKRGDIFVSIHLNSLKPLPDCGIETYYLGAGSPELDSLAAAENQHAGYSLSDLRSLLEKVYMDARRDESKRLAVSVQRALLARLRKDDPELSDRGVKTAPFVVLLATEMPAILAEVSCLSNRTEAERLKTADYRQTIAGALVAGVQAFAH
jgi:N-acetylmuramoyl-L-alanine amidase